MTARQHPLLATILTASLILGLAGCGDDDGSDEEDADVTTEAPGDEPTETTAEPETAAPGLTGEEAEVGDAVATVFDSSVPFDEKVALVEGGEAHRADHDGYVTAADAVGGITIEPTEVAIDGDAATVTYRVLFAGTEAYSDLTMDVTRVDGAWVVSTDTFCGFLASAQTSCAGTG